MDGEHDVPEDKADQKAAHNENKTGDDVVEDSPGGVGEIEFLDYDKAVNNEADYKTAGGADDSKVVALASGAGDA